MKRIIFSAAVVASLTACATVTTGPQASGQAGISYHLPVGKLSLTVVEANGVISVFLAGPVMQADPAYRLTSYLPRGRVSDDTATLKVHDKTNLLTTVSVSSTGRLDDILKNFAGTAGAIQGGDASEGNIRYRALFRLEEAESAQAEANAWLRSYHGQICDGARVRGSAEKDDKALQRICRDLHQLQAQSHPIDIAVEQRPAPTMSSERLDLGPCRVGVCYRPLRPHQVTLRLGRMSQQSETMLFPDEGQLLTVPMPSGVFANQKYDLSFTDGVLTSYGQTSESELVGLATLPIDIAKAIIAAPASLLGARRQALTDQQSYLAAVTALAAQVQTTRDECAKRPNNCPGTALRIIGARTSQESQPAARTAGSNSFQDSD